MSIALRDEHWCSQNSIRHCSDWFCLELSVSMPCRIIMDTLYIIINYNKY